MSTVEETKTIPTRDQVDPRDTWDLSSLFSSDDAWEEEFERWRGEIDRYEEFRGTLAGSASRVAECMEFDHQFERAGERLGTYAFLKTTEDETNSVYQRMQGRYINAASRAGEAASFIRPELLAIPGETMAEYLEHPEVQPYRLVLQRLLRYKKHTLGPKEERLLAMQTEMAQAAGQVFRKLNDADMDFGAVEDEHGQRLQLSHATFASLLHSPNREVRKTAFQQYYREYADHRHTLAAALSGSMQRDIYYARVREYPSALEAALFPDNMPVSVYDNLLESIHRRLPALHRYYDVRRRKMGLDDIHHYDTYVPILSELEVHYPWDTAVELIIEALAPLGDDYRDALARGLRGRWCDRYENRGKQSGAFSCGSFDGDPYILMNYKEDVLDHVFTLAHEAGHSMHSFYSSANQPFPYYDYVIFVAEVASTFNEQLLARHLMDNAPDDRHRAYLINRQLDAMRGTIFRQTMFAEFEKITHAAAEAGEPLTLDSFTATYRELLQQYFGPEFILDDQLSLECFRIPHFYRAFYVYKYATGMSAAIALAQRVLAGGPAELEAYLGFLAGGCSKDPLDLLRDAGVDMETPAPVDAAMNLFEEMVDELDRLI